MSEPKNTSRETFSVGLPLDLAEFVERQAQLQCNSRNGIFRLALTRLREALEGEGRSAQESQPEESAA